MKREGARAGWGGSLHRCWELCGLLRPSGDSFCLPVGGFLGAPCTYPVGLGLWLSSLFLWVVSWRTESFSLFSPLPHPLHHRHRNPPPNPQLWIEYSCNTGSRGPDPAGCCGVSSTFLHGAAVGGTLLCSLLTCFPTFPIIEGTLTTNCSSRQKLGPMLPQFLHMCNRERGGEPAPGLGDQVVTPASPVQLTLSAPPSLRLTHRLPHLGHGQPGRSPGDPASWPRGPEGTWRRLSAQRAPLRGLRAAPRASCAQLDQMCGQSSVSEVPTSSSPAHTLPSTPTPTPGLTSSFAGLGSLRLRGLGLLFPQFLTLGGSL